MQFCWARLETTLNILCFAFRGCVCVCVCVRVNTQNTDKTAGTSRRQLPKCLVSSLAVNQKHVT